MKKIYLLIFVSSFLSACNQNSIEKLLAKTPKINYQKPSNYKTLNNYQKDAIYLTELIKQSYPRLSNKIDKETYLKESKKLIQDLSKIKNKLDFEIRLKKFIALLKDGHTDITIDYSNNKKKRFNLWLYKEKEKWKIYTIDKSIDSTAINSTIIAINNKPINEIEKLINQYECGENKYWKYNQFRYNLLYPNYLKALKIIKKEDENLILTIKKNNETKKIVLHQNKKKNFYRIKTRERKYPFTKQQNEGFYYKVDENKNYAYLQMNTCLDYVSIKSEINNYTNFLTKPLALLYLKKYTKDARNFGLTLQKLFKEIENNNINNLILDLRNNTGGDERTGKQLIWYLARDKKIDGFTDFSYISDYLKQVMKVDYKKDNKLYLKKYGTKLPYGEINITKKLYNNPYFYDITKENSPFILDKSIKKFNGNIYVLIGNWTFSAAQVLATTMYDNNIGIFVGSPTGNKPTGQTGSSGLKLPYSKSLINLSIGYMERPDTSKNELDALYPDFNIHPTLDEIINGEDVQFDYIMKQIKHN